MHKAGGNLVLPRGRQKADGVADEPGGLIDVLREKRRASAADKRREQRRRLRIVSGCVIHQILGTRLDRLSGGDQ